MILTPLTPARGATSATVADIAASMYYLHLRHDTSTASTGVRATLIRRVPATEEQWNVANICEPEHVGEEVVLEMLGHGYRRLAAGGESGCGGGGGGGKVMSAGSGGGPRISRKPVPDSAPQLPPPPPQELPPLVRTMRIEGEGFWHRLKSRRKKSDERIEDAAGGVPARKKKKRDYVFDGLWSDARGVSVGRCEFKDESAGKYLKVRMHILADVAVRSKLTMRMKPVQILSRSALLRRRLGLPPPAAPRAGEVNAAVGARVQTGHVQPAQTVALHLLHPSSPPPSPSWG